MNWAQYHTQPVPPPQAAITWRMCYAAGSQRLAVRVRTTTDDQLSYLLTDHLGSNTKAYPASGGTPAEARYSAWGETRDTTGELPTRRKFTGQLEDSYNLIWMVSRWYDAALGRFITPDSVVPDKGNPQGLDRYAYVANNPLRRT